MARRDPLLVLARLRALERDAARRDLAEAQGVLAAAEAQQRHAEAALMREAADAAPSDYTAWLPAAREARARAAAGVLRAMSEAEAARATLAAARVGAESLEQLLRARRAALLRARRAAEQAALEDAARR